MKQLLEFCQSKISECKEAISLYESEGDEREVRNLKEEISIHRMYLKEISKFIDK